VVAGVVREHQAIHRAWHYNVGKEDMNALRLGLQKANGDVDRTLVGYVP
jgi:hypothetical protein